MSANPLSDGSTIAAAGRVARRRGPGPLVRCVALAALTAGMAASPEAAGQSVGRVAGVADRPRPDYDALGIRLRSFLLFPSTTLAVGYDDNVFATETAARDDIVTTGSAALTLASDWSRHAFSATAFARLTRYMDIDSQDTESWGGSATGLLDLASAGKISADAAYARDVQARSDPESADRLEPSLFDTAEGSLSYIRDQRRIVTRLTGTVERTDFRAAADRLLDRTESSLSARLGYQVSPQLVAFIEPVYRVRDFDSRGDGGEDRDSDEWAGLAGIDLEIASLLIANIAAGYFRTEFSAPGLDPVTGLTISGTATWLPTDLLTLSATVSRATEATRRTDVSTRVNTSAQVTADLEIYRNLLGSARLGVSRDRFERIGREDDTITGGLTLRWLISRKASLYADVLTQHRSSDVCDAEFDRNVVSIGLRFQL